MTRLPIVMLLPIALAGCITSQAMPLSPNTVRLDTEARGWAFTGQTVPQTMKAAATETLNRGYTHFKLADANTGVGIVSTGTSCSFGKYGGGCSEGSTSASKIGVTVTMFHANEPGAKDAFVAADVLQQYSQ